MNKRIISVLTGVAGLTIGLIFPAIAEKNTGYAVSAAQPSGALYGDVNLDSIVDINDLIQFRKYFSVSDNYTNASEAGIDVEKDINSDGIIDLNDLTAFRRYFFNYNPVNGYSSVILGGTQAINNTVTPPVIEIKGGISQTLPGGRALVTLDFTENTEIAAMLVSFEYDENYLTLKKVKRVRSEIDVTRGTSTLTLFDTYPNYEGNGTFANLVFETAPNTPCGEYEIKIKCLEASRYDGKHSAAAEVRTVSAFITVGDTETDGQSVSVGASDIEETGAAGDFIEYEEMDEQYNELAADGTVIQPENDGGSDGTDAAPNTGVFSNAVKLALPTAAMIYFIVISGKNLKNR